MVLESLNQNKAGARENLCPSYYAVEPLAVSKVLIAE